jgi:sulfatase maturation enzyme AslB (radical SAM superfamily)
MKTLNGMKIGQYVKDTFRKLIESNLLTESDFKNLQSKSFSKEVLNQNFEIFRTIEQGPFDVNGYKRYYSNELFANNLLLTSQWFEYHWEPFYKVA